MNRSTHAARTHTVHRLLLGGLAAAVVLLTVAVGAPGVHADTPQITPGLFTLANGIGDIVRLDSNGDGEVYIHHPNDGLYQVWQIEPAPDGYWYLRNLATSLMLDSNAKGSVYTERFNSGPFQQWRMTLTSDGFWHLQSRATRMRLDLWTNLETHWWAAYTHAPNDGIRQKWHIVPSCPCATPAAPPTATDPLGDRVTDAATDPSGSSLPELTPRAPTLQADLTVMSIAGPPALKSGLSGTYTVTVKNQGTRAASLDLGIVFAGKLDQTDQIVAGAGLACEVKRGDPGINAAVVCNGGSLAAGATATVVVQGRGLSAGTGRLVVNVNPSRALSEPDYANNTSQLAVAIN